MIWKRRILFFRSPSDLAGTGLTRLPPKLEIGPEGLGLPEQTPQEQVVDTSDYVRQTLTTLGDGILGDPGDAVLGPLEGTLNLVGYQANVSDSLQAVSHPPQAGPLLVPAVQAVQKGWNLLAAVVPDAISGVSLDELGKRLTYLLYLRALVQIISTFAASLDKTIALVENGIVELLRPVYTRAGSAYATNAKVHTKLADLFLFFTKNAQDAADQRKNNANVEARTRSQMEQEQQAAQPEPPQGPASAPVPPPPPAPAAPPAQQGHSAHPAGTAPGQVKAHGPRTAPRSHKKKPSP